MEIRKMKKLTGSTKVQIVLLLVFSVCSDAQVIEKTSSDSADMGI
jgi:hypothetical protein